MKEMKKQISMRLTETVLKDLAEISKKHGVSQPEVVSILVHWYQTSADVDDIENWFNVARMS